MYSPIPVRNINSSSQTNVISQYVIQNLKSGFKFIPLTERKLIHCASALRSWSMRNLSHAPVNSSKQLAIQRPHWSSISTKNIMVLTNRYIFRRYSKSISKELVPSSREMDYNKAINHKPFNLNRGVFKARRAHWRSISKKKDIDKVMSMENESIKKLCWREKRAEQRTNMKNLCSSIIGCVDEEDVSKWMGNRCPSVKSNGPVTKQSEDFSSLAYIKKNGDGEPTPQENCKLSRWTDGECNHSLHAWVLNPKEDGDQHHVEEDNDMSDVVPITSTEYNERLAERLQKHINYKENLTSLVERQELELASSMFTQSDNAYVDIVQARTISFEPNDWTKWNKEDNQDLATSLSRLKSLRNLFSPISADENIHLPVKKTNDCKLESESDVGTLRNNGCVASELEEMVRMDLDDCTLENNVANLIPHLCVSCLKALKDISGANVGVKGNTSTRNKAFSKEINNGNINVCNANKALSMITNSDKNLDLKEKDVSNNFEDDGKRLEKNDVPLQPKGLSLKVNILNKDVILKRPSECVTGEYQTRLIMADDSVVSECSLKGIVAKHSNKYKTKMQHSATYLQHIETLKKKLKPEIISTVHAEETKQDALKKSINIDDHFEKNKLQNIKSIVSYKNRNWIEESEKGFAEMESDTTNKNVVNTKSDRVAKNVESSHQRSSNNTLYLNNMMELSRNDRICSVTQTVSQMQARQGRSCRLVDRVQSEENVESPVELTHLGPDEPQKFELSVNNDEQTKLPNNQQLPVVKQGAKPKLKESQSAKRTEYRQGATIIRYRFIPENNGQLKKVHSAHKVKDNCSEAGSKVQHQAEKVNFIEITKQLIYHKNKEPAKNSLLEKWTQMMINMCSNLEALLVAKRVNDSPCRLNTPPTTSLETKRKKTNYWMQQSKRDEEMSDRISSKKQETEWNKIHCIREIEKE